MVRTWRKISAPGRLCHQGKYSPSNVLPESSGKPQMSSSTSSSPNDVAKSRKLSVPKRPFARKLFNHDIPKRRSYIERECTPGEVAVIYLLSEFSCYAHRKIEKALDTVIFYIYAVVEIE